MKNFLVSVITLCVILLLGSCASGKKVPYFQNIDEISLAASKGLYDAKIMPKDMLTITVSTTDPAAAAPFNLSVGSSIGDKDSCLMVQEISKDIWLTMTETSIFLL